MKKNKNSEDGAAKRYYRKKKLLQLSEIQIQIMIREYKKTAAFLHTMKDNRLACVREYLRHQEFRVVKYQISKIQSMHSKAKDWS